MGPLLEAPQLTPYSGLSTPIQTKTANQGLLGPLGDLLGGLGFRKLAGWPYQSFRPWKEASLFELVHYATWCGD